EGTSGVSTQTYSAVSNGGVGFNLTGTILSFVWGSPDSWNTLSFYTGIDGAGLLTSLTGSDLGVSGGVGGYLVTIVLDTAFQSVSLASTNPAFEVANLTATPIPPAILLFGSALAGLGLL